MTRVLRLRSDPAIDRGSRRACRPNVDTTADAVFAGTTTSGTAIRFTDASGETSSSRARSLSGCRPAGHGIAA
jgi:hypothetical protein